jgi:hypothetical protein
MHRVALECQTVDRRLRRDRRESIGDVRQIGGGTIGRHVLVLIFETGQQRMDDRTGREFPHRLELIVVIAVAIVLAAQLPAGDSRSRHLGAAAVAVAQHVEQPVPVREAVVDRHQIVEAPAIGDDGPYEALVGIGEWRRIFRGIRHAAQRLTLEVDNAIGIRRLIDLADIDAEIDRVIAELAFELRPEFVIVAAEIAEAVGMRDGRVGTEIEARQIGRAGDIGVGGQRIGLTAYSARR